MGAPIVNKILYFIHYSSYHLTGIRVKQPNKYSDLFVIFLVSSLSTGEYWRRIPNRKHIGSTLFIVISHHERIFTPGADHIISKVYWRIHDYASYIVFFIFHRKIPIAMVSYVVVDGFTTEGSSSSSFVASSIWDLVHSDWSISTIRGVE